MDVFVTALLRRNSEEGKTDPKVETEIKLHDLLADLSDEEGLMIYDSGCYNEVTIGYCIAAMRDVGIAEDTIAAVVRTIRVEHDEFSAQRALELYEAFPGDPWGAWTKK